MKSNNIIMILLIATLSIVACYVASCGGSSAPPVDLPAPITGRVEVGSPDADGNTTIKGTAGAVDPDVTVMAVNESLTNAKVFEFLNSFVPTAYAESTLPSVCSQTGHACAVADSTGAFTITMPASIGHSIKIGVIDATGAFISETITLSVPDKGEPSPEANCKGNSLTGKAVDVKIAPTSGEPILLKQGSDTTTNQLIIGSSTKTTVNINGCYAHSLAVYATSSGDLIVATSKDDKILWKGLWASSAMSGKNSFILTNEPMHVSFSNSNTAVMVALKTSTSVTIGMFSLETGEFTASIDLLDANGNTITGLTRSIRLDVKAMSTVYADNYLGFLITDNGNPTDAYVTIFHAAGTLSQPNVSWSRSQIEPGSVQLKSIADGAIYVSSDGVDQYMNFVVTDPTDGINKLFMYQVVTSTRLARIQKGVNFSTVSLGIPVTDKTPFSCSETMQHVIISDSSNTPRAIASTNQGNLCISISLDLAAPAFVLTPWSGVDLITAITLNDSLSLFYGLDSTTNTVVNGSSLVY